MCGSGLSRRIPARITKAGEIVIHSEEYRDQPKNIQACYDKLREMILAVLRPPKKRRATKPTKGSKVRRLNEEEAGRRRRRGGGFGESEIQNSE